MIDLITIGIMALIILAVFLRKTSAGVAILSLLAGVLLDEILASWLIDLFPDGQLSSDYVVAAVHLILTFTPMIASLIAVKTHKQSTVLSLICSILLGLLVLFFGVKVLDQLSISVIGERTSGFLEFSSPYQNALLATAAVLAVIEMVASHTVKSSKHSKRIKNH